MNTEKENTDPIDKMTKAELKKEIERLRAKYTEAMDNTSYHASESQKKGEKLAEALEQCKILKLFVAMQAKQAGFDVNQNLLLQYEECPF